MIIKAVPQPYEVIFSKGEIKAPLAFIDRNVYEKWGKEISMFQPFIFDANEENKTIGSVMKLVSYMDKFNFDKSTYLIVIGGGITQDVAAFACAIYKRGIKWIYYPTTLLSMADSCIGGKSGINYLGVKNQLGLFSNPERIMIDLRFLRTLPKYAIESGMGEIIKLYLIADFKLPNIRTPLKKLIYYALRVKKILIEEDQFDLGIRKILNYGHTFGHVIEALSDYRIPHGQAVLLGIKMINPEIKVNKYISKKTRQLLKKMDTRPMIDILIKDKKYANGILDLVVKQGHKMRIVKTEVNDKFIKLCLKTLSSIIKYE